MSDNDLKTLITPASALVPGARPDRRNRVRSGLLRWGTVAAAALLVACGGGGDPTGDATAAHPAAAQPEEPEGRRYALAATSSKGRWSERISVPLTPAAMAHLPDGKVLMWSASSKFTFGSASGSTVTAVFDPVTLAVTDRVVSETGHDMFCPGTSVLADGRLLITGGKDSARSSLYDPINAAWSRGDTLNIPRGYHSHATLSDGRVFTLGGSWSGGAGGKHGEIWSVNDQWRRLTGVNVEPAVGNSEGLGDAHMWLIPTGNGRILHAGPGANMNWITTQGEGSISPAGKRGDDSYAQHGNAVMFAADRILALGGSTAYAGSPASNRAYVIDARNALHTRRVADMAYARMYSNAVVLPTGQVLVVGGATRGSGWVDDNGVLVPELWSPQTETFTALEPMKEARNYHSAALLLPDARVLVGGQGLCYSEPCPGNRPDVRIFSPPYLFDAAGRPAVRPVIRSAPASAVHGSEVSVKTDRRVSSFALVRMSAATHSVNNDQRRVWIAPTRVSDTEYRLGLPTNPGQLLPGNWMLFAVNAEGVPSVATILRVTNTGAPRLRPVPDQTSAVGAPVSLRLALVTASGSPVRFSAGNLPPGLQVNESTGTIAGRISQAGSWPVNLTATNGVTTSSTRMVWTAR